MTSNDNLLDAFSQTTLDRAVDTSTAIASRLIAEGMPFAMAIDLAATIVARLETSTLRVTASS